MASNIALMPDIQTRLPMSQGALARGISPAQWRVLVETTFPSAKSPEAIEMAFDYCAARGLDVFKKPVHIVPMWNSAKREYVETVWPGINEIQITAARTGVWAGMDSPKWGPMVTRTFVGERNRQRAEIAVTFPEWCEVTVYRLVGGAPRPFCEPVYWVEAYSTSGGKNSELPTDMWIKRPRGQLHKVAKAASLRAAFPEEGELTAEEMEGKEIEGGGAVIVTRTPATIRAPDPAAESGTAESDAAKIEAFVSEIREKLKAVKTLDELDALWRSGINVRVREIAALDQTEGDLLVGLFSLRKAELTPPVKEVVETAVDQGIEPDAKTDADVAPNPVEAAEDFVLPANLVVDYRAFGTPANWVDWGKACINVVREISSTELLDKWAAAHDGSLDTLEKLAVAGKRGKEPNQTDITGKEIVDAIVLEIQRRHAQIAGTSLTIKWADGTERNIFKDVEDWVGALERFENPVQFHNVAPNVDLARKLIQENEGTPVAVRIQAMLDKAEEFEAARRAEREAA